MPRAAARDPIYRGRRFPTEVIEQCVRWYITYRLSYRDLVAIMAERGVTVTHTTIMRWVLRYVPEYERRWSRFAHSTAQSWRMDETTVNVGGVQHWLYRAVDRYGKSVHSLLSNVRTIDAAKAFFRDAVADPAVQWPTTINLDGNRATHQGLKELGGEDPRWCSVHVRANRYINNLVEQDHRAVKRRCAAMHGLKSFDTAAITIAGVELAHRIRKRQFALPAQGWSSLKDIWSVALDSTSKQAASQAVLPPTHQFSSNYELYRSPRGRRRFSRRCPLRVPYGQGLFMLVTPSGGRYWRYCYRSHGKQKVLALGVYPYVSMQSALLRHSQARQLLKTGIDPTQRRKELRYLDGDTKRI